MITLSLPRKLLLIVLALLCNIHLLYAQLAVTVTPSNYNGSHISCFGAQDGSITANPTGGTPPYIYQWSNQQTNQTIIGLAAGYYRLQVKDNVGAIVYTEITLTEPENLTLENISYEYSNGYNISCWSCSNGIIDIYVDNGTLPYTFLWDDGNTNQSRTNLSPGSHSVSVTDANGCTINSEQLYLSEPERSDWTISGNSGSNPSTHFIGTTDNKDLVFKTNNAERLTLKANGNVKINGTLNVNDSITLNNNRQIGYRAAQGTDPEIMSFGKAPIILPSAITMCTNPNLTPFTFQFNGVMQSYGNASYLGNTQLNSMIVGFDGANAIVEAAGVTPYPYGNNLMLNAYCGHDVGVGNATSGDLYANHNLIVKGAMKLDNGLTPGILQVDAIGNVSSTSTALGLNLWETDVSISADIRNKNSGKVGVGSSNDVLTSKFQVGSSTTRVCIGDAFDATYYMNGYIGFNAGKPSPTSNWVIESNGGTITSPNNAANAIIADGEGNLRFVALPKFNCGGSFWCTPTNEDMHNAARMTVRSDGKVIIGSEQNLNINTATPTPYLLYVKGGVRTERVKVDVPGSWSDFVFENNYRMMNLDELDA